MEVVEEVTNQRHFHVIPGSLLLARNTFNLSFIFLEIGVLGDRLRKLVRNAKVMQIRVLSSAFVELMMRRRRKR